MQLTVQARAKINWTLDVLGTLPNGYHDLDMLMQSVTLCDVLHVEEADTLSLCVRTGGAYVPENESNLVLRAAKALCEETDCKKGARLTLRKYIPVAAGMGGGSSDAAAVLVALNRLWSLGLSEQTLERIGLTVGADVPFCVRGGLARARGMGEKLTSLPIARPLYLVAFQPCRGLSTREVFSRLNKAGIDPSDRPDNNTAARALATGDAVLLGRSMGNVLESVSRRLRPEIDRALREIEKSGACGARMTGSGSAVFGVYRDVRACRRGLGKLLARYPECRMMRTAKHGIVVEEAENRRI